jgi:glutamate 5-kinase
MAGGAGSQFGTGGMLTKVIAAKRAARSGAHTVIASGREQDVILRLARGEPLGTLLVAETQPLTARKQWLADHLQLNGQLLLDNGAINALREGRKASCQLASPPSAAISNVAPPWPASPTKVGEIARGLINYGSSDARRIARRASQDIEDILGYIEEPEIIHRDNLILS